MAHSHKLRIPYKYKGDFSLLQQEIDDAVQKALVETAQTQNEITNSKFNEIRPALERRIQQFFLRVGSQFRGLVEFTKSTEKDVQKVVQEPDRNLQKINEVKLSMLSEAYQLVKDSGWPQMGIPLQLGQPLNIEVIHCSQYKQDIHETFKRAQESVGSDHEKIQRIEQLEAMVVQAMKKLQLQQKIDRNSMPK